MKKQKDLNYQFSWDERRPCLYERVLFVPEYYFEHQSFEMPPLREVFGNDNPVAIEYCSGNGEWILERAKESPHLNWIAVEMRFTRVRKIWSKMHNMGIENMIVVCGDANDFIRYYLPSDSVDRVYVNFPDPWPKEKHAKNRLIQEPFVKEMDRTLREGSEVTIVTDHPEYSEQVIEEMNKTFEPMFESPYYVEKDDEYGTSYFNRLWVEKGCFIRFMKFQKTPSAVLC